MRSVALDLGSRISYCEVSDEKVVRRATVRSISELVPLLGPQTSPAKVALEACREAWFTEAKLREWGHEPLVVDTTRCQQLGIGQHKRKTDRIDAEVLARAVERNAIPLAHVLSPHRQQLRFQLSVRRALVETRAQYVTTVRGLARAHGHKLPRCASEMFVRTIRLLKLDESTRMLIEPLTTLIEQLDVRIVEVEGKLELLSTQEPVAAKLKTAPGVATIVAAAFISVIDEAGRFHHAHEVESYLGLVPSEDTSGKRRLGAISKHGNRYLRALLTQAAWAVLRLRDPNDPLKRWGQAILQRRGKRIAVIAVARRLVGILWAMWRDGTVYEATRIGLSSARGLQLQAQSIALQANAMAKAARKSSRRSRILASLSRGLA